jgi:hypothetical protein
MGSTFRLLVMIFLPISRAAGRSRRRRGNAVCQAHATNSDDALASCQRKLACAGQVRAYLLQIRSTL